MTTPHRKPTPRKAKRTLKRWVNYYPGGMLSELFHYKCTALEERIRGTKTLPVTIHLPAIHAKRGKLGPLGPRGKKS